jgi:biopolymer transport protein ExbB/TolQ
MAFEFRLQKLQTDYARSMHLKSLPTCALVVWLLFSAFVCAQDNPLNDPDLKEMLKEAQDVQKQAEEIKKQNPTSPDTKNKLAEMVSHAQEEQARREEQEKREKEKLQAALKKQLEAPGTIMLPN